MTESKPRKATASKAKAPDKSAVALQAQRDADQDQARTTGVLGDVAGPDHEHAPKPATQAAPDDVSTDPHDAVVVPNGSPTLDLGKVPTVTDTPTPELEGEAYQRGYFGELPGDSDQRPDLTLPAVLAQGATTEQED